jgi:hypothetical protein
VDGQGERGAVRSKHRLSLADQMQKCRAEVCSHLRRRRRIKLRFLAALATAIDRQMTRNGLRSPRMTLFVRITPRSPRQRADGALYAFDISEEELIERVIAPYDHGEVITLSGRSLPGDDVSSIEITEITDAVLGNPLNQLRSLWTTGSRRQTGDWIARHAPSVTDRYVKARPGACARLL